MIHLSAGRGSVMRADGNTALRAPDILWLPAGAAREVQVDAGTTGIIVGVSSELVSLATSGYDTPGWLRQVSERSCLATAPDGLARDEIVRSLHAIEAESRHAQGGLRICLAAHVTLVLVGLWRLTSQDGGPSAIATTVTSDQRLKRFRHLVETQFRSHWSVARYASELGMTADLLHDLCVRTLGQAPLALIHQRVVRECSHLLTSTDMSVEDLAGALGFGSASHLSKFFKRWTGRGPRDWRRHARDLIEAGQAHAPVSYADWP